MLRRLLLACAVLLAAALAYASWRANPRPPSPAVPQRVVSLAPSITEVLYAIDAATRIVGVTSHCNFPAGAQAKPKVGGYSSPNVELVLAARPDLVLVPREGAILGPVEHLRSVGIRVEPITVATLDDLAPAIIRIAELVGLPERGTAVAGTLTARIERVRREAAQGPRVRALFVVDHDPTIAAGRSSFGDDLLRAVGAENVLGGSVSTYPQIGIEAILSLAPEVIVDASMVPGDARQREDRAREYWARFPQLPAVRDRRIIVLDPDLAARPGPRLVDGLEQLAREVQRRR